MGLLEELQEQTPEPPESASVTSERFEGLEKAVNGMSLQMVQITTAVNKQSRVIDGLELPPALTSPPSEIESGRIASIETRLSEIEKTLGVLAENVDGRTMTEVGRKLVGATKATTSAVETLRAEVGSLRGTVTELGKSVPEVQSTAEKAIKAASAAAATAATTTATARVASVGQRIEKLEAVTAQIEGQQLWTKVSAFALSLLPAASLLLGVTFLIGGFAMGLDAVNALKETGGFLNGVRAVFMFVALVATGVGLYKLLMWISGLIEQWKTRPPGR